MKGERVSVSLRLPVELVARMDQFCDERVVGRPLVARRAIEDFLDRHRAPEPDENAPPRNWYDRCTCGHTAMQHDVDDPHDASTYSCCEEGCGCGEWLTLAPTEDTGPPT